MLATILAFQLVAALFGEGTLSTDEVDYGIAFSPDEETAYIVRHSGNWGSRDNPPAKIFKYIKKGGTWESEGYASFSDPDSPWSDSGIFISPDGATAFMVSNRPYEGKPGQGDSDVWVLTKEGEGWSEPKPVTSVNSDGYEASPVTDKKGNLYFASIREGGVGQGDFFMSRVKEDGTFEKPELLKGEVNSEFGEWNLVVSLNSEWIIFESSGRPEGITGYGDLYLSLKESNGEWGKPVHLESINSGGSDLNPRILHRSGHLVFASSIKLESRDVNFYSVDLESVLKEYLPGK